MTPKTSEQPTCPLKRLSFVVVLVAESSLTLLQPPIL